jgi:hypothetical protein
MSFRINKINFKLQDVSNFRAMISFCGFLAVAVVFIFFSIPARAYITENTRPRPLTYEEEQRLVGVNGGCSGFLVDNEDKRLFVATARHCVKYQITEWCSKHVPNTFRLFIGGWSVSGSCGKVIAGSASDDLVIVEVELEGGLAGADQKVRSKAVFSRLIEFNPKLYTRFQMFGFPANILGSEKSLVSGSATASESCWESTGASRDFVSGQLTSPSIGNPEMTSADPVDSKYLALLNHEVRWHNCSTWGGNSGGPIYIEGTNQVAGIPGSYITSSTVSHPYHYNQANFYETTSGFVKRYRAQLMLAKIIVDSNYSAQGPTYESQRKKTEAFIRILEDWHKAGYDVLIP